MDSLELLFDVIVKSSLVAFILLGVGFLAVRLLRQPVERIHLIQVTLASTLIAMVVAHCTWGPKISLPLLPAFAKTNTAQTTSENLKADVFANSPKVGMQPMAEVGESDLRENELTEPGPGSTEKASDVVALPTNSAAESSSLSEAAITPAVATSRKFNWPQAVKIAFVAGFLSVCLFHVIYLFIGFIATKAVVRRSSVLSDKRLRQLVAGFSSRSGNGRSNRIGKQQVRLLVSGKLGVPVATGVWKPAIILPAVIARGDESRIRESLAHEWKHIDRGDLAIWNIVSFCQVLLWPQPFFWSLRRELRVAQDQIADQFATEQQQDCAAYAATLLEYSKHRTSIGSSLPVGALSMAGTKSNLYRRVEMLLNQKFQLSGLSRKRVVFGFTAAMAIASFLMVSLQFTEAAPASSIVVPSTTSPVNNQEEAKESVEDATESVEHTGYVINGLDETPVAGATVICTRMSSDTWTELDVSESKTDANGKYTFTIPPEQLNSRHLYILFDLRHDEGTFAPRHCGSYSYSMVKKNLALGDEPWFAKLRMLPGKKVSAVVVDPAGNPVADAAIRVQSEGAGSATDFSNSSRYKTTTDEKGRFEATVIADGIGKFSIIPLDHCMEYVDLASRHGDLGEITVENGISISGKLLDAVGKPVEGLWINLTEEDSQNEADYSAKRSCQTDENGEFQTRPLKPGRYQVEVETKATGALEKLEYANFEDAPPVDVFVREIIEVGEDSANQPFVIQAVPHVFITGQAYNSKGEITGCHMPHVLGTFKGQMAWIRSTKGDQKGSFVLKIPHGIENAALSFSTNEHSALAIQIGDSELTTESRFEYEKIEEDITDIKVYRYVAPILQVKLVDEAGQPFVREKGDSEPAELSYGPGALRVVGDYTGRSKESIMGMYRSFDIHFEQQTDGAYRSSSLVPDFEFTVKVELEGYESESKTLTLKEKTEEVITLQLKRKPEQAEDDSSGDSEDN